MKEFLAMAADTKRRLAILQPEFVPMKCLCDAQEVEVPHDVRIWQLAVEYDKLKSRIRMHEMGEWAVKTAMARKGG